MIDINQLTPAMRQFMEIKQNHQDCVIFFRMGDFYETFFEDAKICSQQLDIILTSKGKVGDEPIPMAGIPYHSAERYINKLIAHGNKVAIVEQTSQPVPGKIVQREVVEIITPGTLLNENTNNFSNIFAISDSKKGESHMFFCGRGDASLGSFMSKSTQNLSDLVSDLIFSMPKELILDGKIELAMKNEIIELAKKINPNILITTFDSPHNPKVFLETMLDVQSLDGFGDALKDGKEIAISLLLNYLQSLNKSSKPICSVIREANNSDNVIFDRQSLANLEVFESTYNHNIRHSLRGVINHCSLSAGSRTLREILMQPTKNLNTINRRHQAISDYFENIDNAEKIQKTLKDTVDLQKMATRIIKKPFPVLFLKIKQTLDIALNDFTIKTALDGLFGEQEQASLKALSQQINDAIEPEIGAEDEFFIKMGLNEQIDELKSLVFHADQLLLDYQRELCQKTGVNNIKIKYILNQGYFLEVTKKESDNFEKSKVMGDEKFDLVRVGTLKSGERYSTSFLSTLEKKILSAKQELLRKESEIIIFLKLKITKNFDKLTELNQKLGWLDLFTSHAIFCKKNERTKPEISDNNDGNFEIIEGRHPVVEHFLNKNDHFINNDCKFEGDENTQIITGPNMGGKSTFLRQTALIILLGQCGLFVPAKKAEFSLIDGIFARIGAGDNLVNNQSTFMTEMLELSSILNHATKNSFIVIDELGRGTSTFDGLALSQSVITYIATKIKAKTLIATHYHELTKLEEKFKTIKNYSVQVYETPNDIVFLKKISKGGASKSYGIEVAKRAGIQQEILDEAKKTLSTLENQSPQKIIQNGLFEQQTIAKSPENEKHKKISDLITEIDINSTTPIDALRKIEEMKKILNS